MGASVFAYVFCNLQLCLLCLFHSEKKSKIKNIFKKVLFQTEHLPSHFVPSAVRTV